MNYEDFCKRRAEVIRLMADGNAEQLGNIVLAFLGEEYRKAEQKRKASGGSQPGTKRRQKIDQIVATAIFTLLECDDWEDMIAELPLALSENNIKVDDRTWKKVLEKKRRFIEYVVDNGYLRQ